MLSLNVSLKRFLAKLEFYLKEGVELSLLWPVHFQKHIRSARIERSVVLNVLICFKSIMIELQLYSIQMDGCST